MRNTSFAKSLAFFMAFALLLSALALGAPVSAQDPTATPEPSPTPLPAEEGTLTIWADQNRLPPLEALGKSFEEQYGIPVRIQQMGFGDIRNNFNIAAPAGEGPDIIIGAHDWIGQLYSNGLLAEIELPEDLAANFNPAALRAFTYDGKLVGLPYAVEAVGMFYNKDLVETPPTTWDEVAEVGMKLVEEGKAEQAFGIPPDSYHHYPFFTSYGGYVFGTDEMGGYNPDDVGLDSPGQLAAGEKLAEFVAEGAVRDGVDYGRQQELFTTGQMPFWFTGPWALAALRDSDVNYGVAPIPSGTEAGRPFLGAQGFMVNAFSPNLQLALSLLTEFAATDETMLAMFEADPRPPAMTTALEQLEDEDIVAFAQVAENADPMPAIPQMNSVWSAWDNARALVYSQQGNADDLYKEAAAAVRELIASGE
ncbi:MAG: maltose ABC transporter substrate-binding protein [Anaerolineae bacterium]|nr:maltose ABC transporter substrate-binding protein [Anaerolineae bacterium]